MSRTLVVRALVAVAVLLLLAVLLVRRLVDPEVIRVAVEQQASAALGQPVKVGAVDWALSARPRVVLTNVQIGSPAAITLNKVTVSTGLRALLNKRVEGADLVVSGSRITLPLPFALGTGGAAAPATPTEAAAGFVFESIDRISLSDIELSVANARLVLHLESSLHGGALKVSRLRLTSERTSLEGSGEFSSLAQRKAAFTVTGNPLDLDELIAIASGASATGTSAAAPATAPAAPPAAAGPMDVRFTLKAPKGRLLGIDFANLDTTLTVTREALTLDPFVVGLFDGTISGRVALDTKASPATIGGMAKVQGIDVAKLATFAGSAGVITGRLGGEIDLRAEAGAPDVVFRTATGRATLAITEGTIPGLDLVGPVILAFGKPDQAKAEAKSSAFTSLGGTFSLAGGTLRSDDIKMLSRDLDMKGHGSLKVAGAGVDLKADLVLSEELTAQAGRDLVRYAHEGNRVVVPVTVTGPLSKPTVFIDVAAAAGRALRNAAEEELKKGLGRLFKH